MFPNYVNAFIEIWVKMGGMQQHVDIDDDWKYFVFIVYLSTALAKQLRLNIEMNTVKLS